MSYTSGKSKRLEIILECRGLKVIGVFVDKEDSIIRITTMILKELEKTAFSLDSRTLIEL